jgi:hypothetical protein
VYNYADEYPDLRYLAVQLGHFAYEYLRSSLELPDSPEAERDIYGVLERCLVRESDGADMITFAGAATKSLSLLYPQSKRVQACHRTLHRTSQYSKR